MKITYRISTAMYEFVEVEQEITKIIGAAEIRQSYDELSEAFKPQPINSLPEKEWRGFLEKLLLGEPNHIDMYEKCSPEQKKTVNEIKKTLKRLEAKSETNNHE